MCDESGKTAYGFGAAADILEYLPFMRNIMSFLAAGSASYNVLHDGLELGKCKMTNPYRKPTGLFILPGGVAEIFTSTVGKHAIVVNKEDGTPRVGLVRLAISTGANIVPCYVFGATDFFYNLSTQDTIISKIARKLRAGITWFYGQLYTPFIPFTPTVTLCLGEPIVVEKWTKPGKIPDELINQVHDKYVSSVKKVFEQNKVAAGHKGAVLQIV
jgi:hypothetical protein